MDQVGIFALVARPGPRVAGRRLPPLPIAALIVAAVVANAWYLGWTLVELLTDPLSFDWEVLVESGRRVRDGGLYDHDPYYLFVWSPLAAWLFALLEPIGMWGWRLLHLLAIPLIPDRRLQLLVLLSWPFWVDLEAGNIMIFVLVAAIWALRGNTMGMLAFVTLTFLAPRPLHLPVLAWIVVTRPGWRLPIAALALVHLALVIGTGWGPDWVATVLGSGGRELDNSMNVGPSQITGAVWIPVGLALGAWLTTRGRLGWASLAVSPYWLPMYLLIGFLEFNRAGIWADRSQARSGRRSPQPAVRTAAGP